MNRISLPVCIAVAGLINVLAMGQATPISGENGASSLVGTWEIDSESTIRRAVGKTPDNEKQRVRQELSLLLPKQRYVFVADGTYKITTTAMAESSEDAGTYGLTGNKLTLVSSGKGGTRTVEVIRDDDKLVLADQLVLVRPAPNRAVVAATQPAGANRTPARRQAKTPDARPAGGQIEQTAFVGTKSDQTRQTVISRTDHMTGLAFELTAGGDIALIRSVSQKQRMPAEMPNQKIVTARPGYVMYGVQVDGKARVNAIRLVFVRKNDDNTFAHDDIYESDWVGTLANNKIVMLGGDGRRVGGFSASTKDGLLSGMSLGMTAKVVEETDLSKAAASKAATSKAAASPQPFMRMLNDLSTTLESVKDAATARQALEQIHVLKEQYQNIGMGTAKPDGLEPLMQRVQQTLGSIQRNFPEEGRALETATRDLVASAATPQERGAAANGAKQIASAAKLKQIAIKILLREGKGGTYPATLQDLVRDGSIKSDLLDSPMGDATGGDFVYIRPDDTAKDNVLLYDAAALIAGEGTNVAFIDGSVRWVKTAELRVLNIPRPN